MVRSGVAAIALLLWVSGSIRVTRGTVAAGVIYAVMLSLFVGSTKLTTAASAIFLQSTAPLYLLLLAPVVLHEHVRRRDGIYLAVVAAGMLLCFAGKPVASSTAPNPVFGNWLAAASGLTWALTLMTLRHIGRADRKGDVIIAAVVIGNIFGCLVAVPFALPLPAASSAEWATLVYLGAFQIGLAYVCLASAIRKLPALEISLLLLVEPVLNPIWTWIVRGEDPGMWTILGGFVIVTATAIKVVVDASLDHQPKHEQHAH